MSAFNKSHINSAILTEKTRAQINRRILETYQIKASADKISKALEAIKRKYDIFEGMIHMGDDFWIMFNLELLEEISIQENEESLAQKIFELWWERAGL